MARAVAWSVPVARVRRSSRSTVGASSTRVAKLERDLERLAKNRADPAQGPAAARAARPSPWSGTRTPASRRSSTASPTPTCSSRTVSSPRSIPPPGGSRLPGGETVLVSDTVGFVQRLPHQLVEAFQSTLEEVVDAELLLHVVDAGSPDAERQIAAVRAVLSRDRRRPGARAPRAQQGRRRRARRRQGAARCPARRRRGVGGER